MAETDKLTSDQENGDREGTHSMSFNNGKQCKF